MSQRRLTWSSLIAAAAATMVLGMPGIAAANGYWHPANNEAGFTTHPDHFKSSKTRAEVRAEAEAAMRQQGGLSRFNANSYPAPVQANGPGKTRQQVIDELVNETPAARSERESMWRN